jgi:hypothetical protein
MTNKTDWYEEAADKFIAFLGDLASTEIPVIKHLQENDVRFHFEAGRIIRNDLRELGYSDSTYGNLDDHYQEILKLVYSKEGLA